MRFGYINPGPDQRPLGRVGGVVQWLLSLPFAWLHRPPLALTVGTQMIALPPFVAINWRRRVPARPRLWRTVRVGWRYDVNAKRYIADVILKLREDAPRYY